MELNKVGFGKAEKVFIVYLNRPKKIRTLDVWKKDPDIAKNDVSILSLFEVLLYYALQVSMGVSSSAMIHLKSV